LATSPLSTVAGHQPFSDLLFSPRAAFIWNHTRKGVAWMNPAARAAFGLCLKDFSDSLPLSLIRHFARRVEVGAGGPLKVKIGREAALKCSVEPLKLAGGQDGLIIAEVPAEGESRAASGKTAKSPKEPARKAPRAPNYLKEPAHAPMLTAEEMRAFKAIGRKVRRLCKEKKRSQAATAASPPSPLALESAGQAPEQAAQALKDVLSAFDLVLLLDRGLDIMRVEHRTQRLGWRKASLHGKPFADLLLPVEQAVLRRMLKKLDKARCSKDTLAVLGAGGNSMHCLAVLGRWEEGGCAYFLALLSLELPARLKKRQAVSAAAATRLAA
jgi:hypothetical protein